MAAQLVDWWSDAEKAFRRDKHLGPLVKRYQGEGLQCRNDLFHTLCRSIVGQQISVRAADSVWQRFNSVVGRIKPRYVSAATESQLRAAGLSRMKASYILGLAAEARSLQRMKWDELDDEEAIRRLTELRGVGRWTAEMALIFSFGRPDVLPLGDIGLIRAAETKLRKGKPMPIQKIKAVARAWRPFRTAATWYLWRSIDPVPVEY